MDKEFGVITEKMDAFGRVLEEIHKDIKAMKLKSESEALALAAAQVRFSVLSDKVNDHDKKISEFEKLVPWIKIVAGLSMILATSVISLIVSILSGQVQLVFP